MTHQIKHTGFYLVKLERSEFDEGKVVCYENIPERPIKAKGMISSAKRVHQRHPEDGVQCVFGPASVDLTKHTLMERPSKPIIYRKKTITSGDVIEQLEYQRPVTHGFVISPKWKEKRRLAKEIAKKSLTPQQLLERRVKNRTLSMTRAKKTLTRLVDANVYQYHNIKGRPYPPVFLTLTFKEDIKNQKQANEKFSFFIKRLNYHVSKKISNPLCYLVVVEFQDKNRGGVIHYHLILYDLPLIRAKTLQDIWREGGINIRSIVSVKKIGNYISKYMSKNFQDARLDGHKRYFSSRGLIKPKVYAGDIAYTLIQNAIPKDTPKKESSFVSEKLGEVKRVIYKLKDRAEIKDFLHPEESDELSRYDISQKRI